MGKSLRHELPPCCGVLNLKAVGAGRKRPEIRLTSTGDRAWSGRRSDLKRPEFELQARSPAAYGPISSQFVLVIAPIIFAGHLTCRDLSYPLPLHTLTLPLHTLLFRSTLYSSVPHLDSSDPHLYSSILVLDVSTRHRRYGLLRCHLALHPM